MPRRCIRISLALIFLLSSNAWALGLGEIRLDSALNGPMQWSFWTMQVKILSIIPFFILMWLSLRNVNRLMLISWGVIVSIMLLMQVFFMRWNVIIGGQIMGKSGRGFAQYHPLWFDKEGILVTIIILAAPIVILWLLSKIFPFWDRKSDNEVV